MKIWKPVHLDTQYRMHEMAAKYSAGKTVEEIAKEENLALSVVYRYLGAAKIELPKRIQKRDEKSGQFTK